MTKRARSGSVERNNDEQQADQLDYCFVNGTKLLLAADGCVYLGSMSITLETTAQNSSTPASGSRRINRGGKYGDSGIALNVEGQVYLQDEGTGAVLSPIPSMLRGGKGSFGSPVQPGGSYRTVVLDTVRNAFCDPRDALHVVSGGATGIELSGGVTQASAGQPASGGAAVPFRNGSNPRRVLTGYGVFVREQGSGKNFVQLSQEWKALTPEQRRTYDTNARRYAPPQVKPWTARD